MKPKLPQPHFEESAFYEQVAHIMRTRPETFRVFSPQTKYALSIYLEMKERHERQAEAA